MKRLNPTLLKSYLLLMFVMVALFWLFIHIEKNNVLYSFRLNNHNQLSQKSLHILEGLNENKAVKFEVFTNKDSSIAHKITKFFMPYKRINNNIQVEFVDPATNPSKVQKYAITMQGEILLTSVDPQINRKINITELSESAIINAILRLQSDKDEWLIIAEGFGMKSIDDESQSGFSNLLIHLQKIGIHIASMPINENLVLPEKVKIIMLPSPKEVLNVEFVQWLQQQNQQGIGIWWLNDVDNPSQPHLEIAFDIMSGDKKHIAKDKFSAYISDFPKHPITDKFNQPIYIAEAIEIISDSWQTLIYTEDKNAIAVSKQLQNSRNVIVGDADFISNQFIDSVANKSMAVRILDWMFYHDDRVNIPLQINKNTQLILTQTQLISLSVFFLIILPLFFLIIAFKQWRRLRG